MENPPSKKYAIMTATKKLIAQRGFANTPVSLISKVAGTGEGTIYRHFRSKNDLLHAVLQEALKALKHSVVEGVNTEAGVRERFIRLMTNIYRYFLQNLDDYLFIEQYLNTPLGMHERQGFLCSSEVRALESHPLVDLLEKARREKAIKNLPTNYLLALVYAPCSFMIKESILSENPIEEEDFQAIIKSCWEAIQVP